MLQTFMAQENAQDLCGLAESVVVSFASMRLVLAQPLRTQNAVARALITRGFDCPVSEWHAACNSAFESVLARVQMARPSQAIPTLFTLRNQSSCAPARSYGAS